MRLVHGAAAALFAFCISAPAIAADADYPNRPVRIVVTTRLAVPSTCSGGSWRAS